MRARWTALIAMIAMMLHFGAGAAFAVDPVDLGSGYVLDQSGVLSSAQLTEANTRLAEVSQQTGAELYIVFVDSFTNPADSEQWANEVADRNGLGTRQYLLAVSTQGRQLYLSAESAGPLSESQIVAVEDAAAGPLGSGDYAGAVSAAADSFRSAFGGGGGAASGGGAIINILLFVVIAGLAVLVLMIVVRSKRKARQPVAAGGGAAPRSGLQALDTKELSRRAASALVHTDDAVRTSEQELGFARAQFGDAAAAPFGEALELAKRNLAEAFTLRQKLDDDVPDTEADVRAWNIQILQLLDEANTQLDEKAAAFDELRKLEQNAPEALTAVQEQRNAAAAAIDHAHAQLTTLAASYAPEALATVADNPEQARQRLAFAQEQLTTAERLIGAGNGGEAAVSIRAAEEAVGQAKLLEDAIGRLAHDLAQGEQAALALSAEVAGDIVAASALPDPDGRMAGVVAATRQQLDAARANLAGTQKRPLVALQQLEAANAQLDSVVQGARDAQARTDRARQILGQTITQAQAQVQAAEDYVMARRGAIGAEARTRLAEAGASLVHAQQLQAADPEQALQYAQRANQLAAQAIQYAQNDVGAFQNRGMTGGSGGGGGNMLGAVLGGIAINSLLNSGGGGGRSYGGGRSSGGRGRSGGGGRSGGLGPGSFGGGGTRARRGGRRF